MAAIISKHEDGVDADPSSFDVLQQLARYAPTDIDDEDDGVDEANDSRAPSDSSARPLKARKRQRSADTPPSTNASEPDQAQSMAPMFDLVPNPQQAAGSRAASPGPVPGFDTIMQFMQSMRDGRGALMPALHQTLPFANATPSSMESAMPLSDMNYAQPVTMAPDSLTAGASFQPDSMSFDFTSLIDWETSLANFESEQLLNDEGWDQNFLPRGLSLRFRCCLTAKTVKCRWRKQKMVQD